MSLPSPAPTPAAPAPAPERDPNDPRIARRASGLLAEFNRAGVIAAADVHVARRLGALGDERDDAVLLAVALAVRGPRLGHVLVDLATVRDTATVDAEEPVDVGALRWPDPAAWIARVRDSPLVADGDDDPAVRPLRLVGSGLYLDRYWSEEVTVAAALRAMGAGETPCDAARLRDGLARLFGADSGGRQAQAADTAVRRRLTVVAGGPGTGKTTTVARIVALLCEQAAPGSGAPPLIALAAPTGKAAARLQEAVRGAAAELDVAPEIRDQLRAIEAVTIHRLLGYRPQSASRFRHDRNQRLPHDTVIVDESSMVSLSLMARLIEALRADARLVLVGDPGQLASIEAGAVLGDIVGPAGGHGARPPDPIVVLDRVHRYGGAIAQLAVAIRAGDADAVMALLVAGHDDVTWVASDVGVQDAPAEIREPALICARAVIAAAREGRGPAALQALGAFRILCAHRRGPYGVATWTTRVQSWLAAELEGFDPEERWYVGRPLLIGENDYELGLNNGDTGVIVRRDADHVAAVFERAGETVDHSPSRLSAVDTVYAMTIHKSQGSQFDAAAVLLPDTSSRILTRELFYTAATRARRWLIVAGTEQAVRAAVARPVARASGLGRRLHGPP